jgi:hypothetical protein
MKGKPNTYQSEIVVHSLESTSLLRGTRCRQRSKGRVLTLQPRDGRWSYVGSRSRQGKPRHLVARSKGALGTDVSFGNGTLANAKTVLRFTSCRRRRRDGVLRFGTPHGRWRQLRSGTRAASSRRVFCNRLGSSGF